MRLLWHMPTLRTRGCGLSRRALALAKQLREHGHEVIFAVRRDATDAMDVADAMDATDATDSTASATFEDSTVARIGGFPVCRLDVSPRRPWHWSLQALARRHTADDVVRALEVEHDVFLSCQPEVVAAYADRTTNKNLLVYICGGTTLLHDPADIQRNGSSSSLARMFFAVDRRLKQANEANGFARADLVVFDSVSTQRRVIDRYGLEEMHSAPVYGGVCQDECRPITTAERRDARRALGLAEGAFVVVWTGRLAPEKNVELLIQSVGACRRRPDCVLLVGDGPSRSALEELARAEGAQACIRFVGERPDVNPYLVAADVFAFPSISESFGGSLIEAMARGLPCVALRPDGQRIMTAGDEIIEHERTGLLVDRAEPAVFAAALDRLADDPDLRTRLGAAALSRATARFTWEAGGLQLSRRLSAISSQPESSEQIERHPERSACHPERSEGSQSIPAEQPSARNG